MNSRTFLAVTLAVVAVTGVTLAAVGVLAAPGPGSDYKIRVPHLAKDSGNGPATAAPSPTAGASVAASPSSQVSPGPSQSVIPSPTPSASANVSPGPTSSPSPSPSVGASPSPSPSPSPDPSPSASPGASPSPSPSASPSPTEEPCEPPADYTITEIADIPEWEIDFKSAVIGNFDSGTSPGVGACAGQLQSITVALKSTYGVSAATVRIASVADPGTPLVGPVAAIVTGSGQDWSMSAAWTLPLSLQGADYFIQLSVTNTQDPPKVHEAWIQSIRPAR